MEVIITPDTLLREEKHLFLMGIPLCCHKNRQFLPGGQFSYSKSDYF